MIAGFFDYYYLCKQTINVIDYCCWLGVARHAQTCLSFSSDQFNWSGGGMATLEITENSRLI